MEDVEREREKGQERRSMHQIQGNARGGRVERRRRKGRASRKTLGFARSGLVAAVASERVREWRREPPQSRRTALSSTKALRDTLLHSLTVFSLDSFFSSAPLLPSFLPSSPLRWNFISSLTGPPTPLFLLIPSLFDRGFLLLLLFFSFYRCSIYDFIFRFTIVLLTIQFLAYFPSNLRKKNLISLGHLLLPSPLSIIVQL